MRPIRILPHVKVPPHNPYYVVDTTKLLKLRKRRWWKFERPFELNGYTVKFVQTKHNPMVLSTLVSAKELGFHAYEMAKTPEFREAIREAINTEFSLPCYPEYTAYRLLQCPSHNYSQGKHTVVLDIEIWRIIGEPYVKKGW